MAGIGQEAAGIGEHADEVPQHAAVGKGGELLDHASLVVVKPPGGPLLNPAQGGAVLETADDGVESFVVVGVQAVKHHPGQGVLRGQQIQKLRQL